jgi:hypothetical protein
VTALYSVRVTLLRISPKTERCSLKTSYLPWGILPRHALSFSGYRPPSSCHRADYRRKMRRIISDLMIQSVRAQSHFKQVD